MSDPTNETRAEWAEAALNAFQKVCRTDDEEAIGDLVCDLMHLAAKRGEVPSAILRAALSNYEAEVAEESAPAPGR